MSEEQYYKEKKPLIKETDLIELVRKVWTNRKFIFKVCCIAAIIGLIVGFSIPKQYTAKVVMAPEITGKSGLSGSMGALASMAGINLGNMSGEDAIAPQLYPKIISSPSFLTNLFSVQVVTKKGELHTTLYDYMDKHQKVPWWGYIIQFPGKIVKQVLSAFKEDSQGEKNVNSFRLTREQANIAKAINKSISPFVDKKTDVITLSVTMQDPLIAACLADTIKEHLQKAIIDYRTGKARSDLEFAERLYNEAQVKYFEAQQAYADYVDANVGVVFARFEIEETRLKNEQTLAYNIYNQVAQQLQMAKAKVQESTPVFAVVQSATVPLQGSNMGKAMILVLFIFLGMIGAILWVLLKGNLMKFKNIFS